MKNHLQQVLVYKGNKIKGDTIRVVMKDNTPWWVAEDICKVLNYKDSQAMMKKILIMLIVIGEIKS
ncbi:BRO family protein [Paenibacillus chitinolyticus]|uniref:BRO family protein n=1 Tax=Paenibacillus chitinolyticus TaxID=79263 RepID=UPI003D05BFC6